jgi:murein DD-endopeptidase MepM/ murein hydrolase activator NlpD
MHVALFFALVVAAAPAQDTALFPAREALIRMYTDCDESRWPWGLDETFVTKSDSELVNGVAQLRAYETRWRAYFAERAGDSIAPTPEEQWVYPLTLRGRLLDNFNNPRVGGPHEALDIFVTREGVPVRSPVSGVVIAAGDDWQGRWVRRKGLEYEGGGLSRRAGNGAIIYDPASGKYFYFAHLQPGITVRTGDVIRAGHILGRVGHTGNASQPGHGKHLHFAVKKPGMECNVEGVLVSDNPYRGIRAARNRLGR